MNQILLMKEGECKFNIPLKLRKSFQVNDSEDKMQAQNVGFAAMPEQFKNLNLEPGKYFWGYANVDQVDMQGDLFPIETLEDLAPGLTQAPYNKIFLNHDYTDIASGTIVATATDSRGLLILGKLNEDHQRAWEIWQSILNESLDGLSMGGSFLEVESYYDEANDLTVTVAKKATATEVSLTSIPINGGSMLMGAFQKAKKKYTKKFGDPKLFMKGKKVEEVGKFKYEKSQDKSMVKENKLSEAQKKIYDKAISEGKSEKEANDMALKNVNQDQVDEAEENVNQDLVGKKNVKQDKPIKKSLDEEKVEEKSEEPAEESKEETEEPGKEEETESEEASEEKTEEVEEKSETEESEKTEEAAEGSAEEKEDPVDYKKAFEEMKAKNEELTKELSNYQKSLPKKEESEEPIRKSKKTAEEAVPNTEHNSTQKDGTPFLSWLKN